MKTFLWRGMNCRVVLKSVVAVARDLEVMRFDLPAEVDSCVALDQNVLVFLLKNGQVWTGGTTKTQMLLPAAAVGELVKAAMQQVGPTQFSPALILEVCREIEGRMKKGDVA